METQLYIPKKIKVGYQKREDTYSKKLAYIIYYDDKGKLRKETSWQSWRDKKIDPQDFDNVPTEGFTLNKDIKRYHGGWFSSNRTMIRIHDPRGFEFEVTTENLIGILMHTDCLRRGLIGQFVYAWVGPELVLLPTNSEEYQNAVKYTTNLSKKVKSKELTPGVSYKTKREGDVIYIGKFNWYGYISKKRYGNAVGTRQEEKALVFTYDDGETFVKKPSASFLAESNSDTPVSNFAELVTKFNEKSYANKIVSVEFTPTEFDATLQDKEPFYGLHLVRTNYFTEHAPGVFCNTSVNLKYDNIKYQDGTYSKEYHIIGYELRTECYGPLIVIKKDTGEIIELPDPRQSKSDPYYYRASWKPEPLPHDLAYMRAQKFYDCYVVYENGKREKFDSIYELSHEND